jgi:P2 family phage contractile tail tube protein
MSNSVWTMEEANIFCGSGPLDGTNSSNHLTLTEVKLPGLDQQYVDHRAGGAPVTVEISTIMARLECTFMLVGVTPQVMELLRSWLPSQNWFTIYGVIRDQITGELAQAAAAVQGQLARVDPQNWRRGDVMHTAYSIRGIRHYELQIASEQIYLWDFAENTFVVNGNDQNKAINSMLNVTGTTVTPRLTNTTTWVQAP